MNVATAHLKNDYTPIMTSPLSTMLLIDAGAGLATLAIFGIVYQAFRSVLLPRRASVIEPVVSEKPAYFDRIY